MLVRILIAAAAALLVAAPVAAAEAPRVRKDAAALTATEKRDFVAALHALKRADYPYDDDPDGIRWYDRFVRWHVELAPCDQVALGHPGMWGHGGPMFLPWHRQYLRLLEDALREVSGKHVTIPYWDWTREPSTRAVLADDLMGGAGNPDRGYRLERGPFRHDRWPLDVGNSSVAAYALTSSRWITRNIGSPMQATLTVKQDLPWAMSRPVYDTAPWGNGSDVRQSFRKALEGFQDRDTPWMGQLGHALDHCGGHVSGRGPVIPWPGAGTLHNQVHMWVGGITGTGPDGGSLFGTMNVPLASPNDPIFWLHHANIDRLWAVWQRSHRGDAYRPRGPAHHEEFPANEIDDPLHPWPVTPRDVADSAALGVVYAEPGRASARGRRALVCRL